MTCSCFVPHLPPYITDESGAVVRCIGARCGVHQRAQGGRVYGHATTRTLSFHAVARIAGGVAR